MSVSESASVSEFLSDACTWCPRACGANRTSGERGVCGAADELRIARCALHYWEEPPISGSAGSGTIFFSHCPLHCVYCQNAHIAHGESGKPVPFERLVDMCLELQAQGAMNINMVTPTHHSFVIAAAVRKARNRGLTLPVVWNTSGYENAAVLSALNGIVDVYLTDFKYISSQTAQAYSSAPDYPQVAFAAIDEMLRQTGPAVYDCFGGEERMVKGTIVRHLLLPGHVEESYEALRLLFERYGNAIRYSIMNQYTPVLAPESKAAQAFPWLLERVADEEYDALLDYADDLGIRDYFWQDGPAAVESFIPSFDNTGV